MFLSFKASLLSLNSQFRLAFKRKASLFTLLCFAPVNSVLGATITINTISGDDNITATEDNSSITFTGTTSLVEDGNEVQLQVGDFLFLPTVTGNTWSQSVPAFYIEALNNSVDITADVSDNADTLAQQAVRTVTHIVPKVMIDDVASNRHISETERETDLTITGQTVNVEDGQNVNVMFDGVGYLAAVNNNAWSFTIPQADLVSLSQNITVIANVSDQAGNNAKQTIQYVSNGGQLFDTDGDGIYDDIDLDSDNDGLLNSQEQSCVTHVELNSNTYTLGDDLSAGALVGNVTQLGASGNTFFDLKYSHGNTATPGTGIRIINEPLIGNNVIEVAPENATGSAGSTAVYDLQFSQPVYLENLSIGNVDQSDQVSVRLFDENNAEHVVGAHYFSLIGNINNSGNGFSFEGLVPNGLNANSTSQVIQVTSRFRQVSRISLVVSKSDNSAAPVTLQLSQLSYCVADNTDNDLLPSHLDLDSDNDGIPDNIEAQSTASYQAPTGTVNTSGVDTQYAAGLTPVNTTVNTPLDFLNTDSDNDGITDLEEATGIFVTDPSVRESSDTDRDGLLDIYENMTPDDGFVVNDGVSPSTFINTSMTGEADHRDTLDTDSDGIADVRDLDDDNDGLTDAQECPGQIIEQTVSIVSGSTDVGELDPYWTVKWPALINVANAPKGNNVVQRATVSGKLNASWYTPQNMADWVGFNFSGIPNGNTRNGIGRPIDADNDNNINEPETGFSGDTNDFALVDHYATFMLPSNALLGSITGVVRFSSDNKPLYAAINGVSTTNTAKLNNIDFNRAQSVLMQGGFKAGINTLQIGVGSLSGPMGMVVDNFNVTYSVCTDTDTDTFKNHIDIDADNDGIPDNIEAQQSASYVAPTNMDTDLDGLDNAYDTDNGGTALVLVNSDDDTTVDYLDINSDNDANSDQRESGLTAAVNTVDTDNDGLLDAYENGMVTDGFISANGVTNPLTAFINRNADNEYDARQFNAPELTINAVATDGLIDAAEDDADVTVSGTALFVEEGRTVALTINGADYTATVMNGVWSVVIPQAEVDLLADNVTITANVSSADDTNAPQVTQYVVRDTLLVDTDRDGVFDYADTDSDNDGILNSQEQMCVNNVELNSNGNVLAEDLSGGVASGTLANLGAFNQTFFDFSYDLNGVAAQGAGIRIVNEPLVGAHVIDVAPELATGAPNIATYNMTFNQQVYISNLSIGGIDQNDRVSVRLFDGFGMEHVVGPHYFTVTGDISNNSNAFSFVGLASNSLDSHKTSQVVQVHSLGRKAARIQIIVDKSDTSSQPVSLQFSQLSYCVEANTDNDLNPNHLDIDSDNDGIPDNIEAQATTGYQAPTGTVNMMGVDTVYAGGLTPVNTIVTTPADYINADSDNDGMTDLEEATGIFVETAQPRSTGDSDSDGLLNVYENATSDDGFVVNDSMSPNDFINTAGIGEPDHRKALDTDGDSIANVRDLDDDNDGIIDLQECPSQVVDQRIAILSGTTDVGTVDPYWTVKWPALINVSTAVSGSDIVQRGIVSGKLNQAFYTPQNNSNWIAFDFTGLPTGNTRNGLGSAFDLDNDGVLNERAEGFSGDTNEYVELVHTATFMLPKGFLLGSASAEIRFSSDNVPQQLSVNGVETLDVDTLSAIDFNRARNVKLQSGFRAGLNTIQIRVSSQFGLIGLVVDDFIITYNTCSDTDEDGFADHIDIDADNDSIPDNIEAQLTANYTVALGIDTDMDGLDNAYDSDDGGVNIVPVNTDNEDSPDYLDLNSDNDDSNDLQESGNAIAVSLSDTDSDGLLDDYENGSVNDGFIANDGITAPLTAYTNLDSDGEVDLREFNGPPAVTVSPVTSDNVINLAEAGMSILLTGTTVNVDNGQTVTLELDGVMYTAVVTNSMWSVEVPATSVQNLGITETLLAVVTNEFNETSQVVSSQITRTTTSPTISIAVVSEDDTISTDESSQVLVVTGGTTLVEDGVMVMVTVLGQVFEGAVLNNLWTVNVPASTVRFFNSQQTLSANVSNNAGDPATQATRVVTSTGPSSNADTDGDGIPNLLEGLGDLDNDDIPNYLDTDSDGDSLSDALEAATSGLDENDNGIDDAFDAQILDLSDTNNDGVADDVTLLDSDGDGQPDVLDIDSDNDTIPDLIEAGINGLNPPDTDGDGVFNFRDLDSDGDRLADIIEVNGNPLVPVDSDMDTMADYVDIDSDNDGIIDTLESINIPAPLLMDINRNGIDDSIDVLLTLGVDANINGVDDRFDALNTDGDELPDYLDRDSDGDTLPDSMEYSVVLNAPFIDTNANGITDVMDSVLTLGADMNSNGIDDAFEPLDSDLDGLVDFQDTDSDNDQIEDGIEGAADVDRDGLANFRDLDSDGDGISDIVEVGNVAAPVNTDDDNAPDYLDIDSDNDMILDNLESLSGVLIDTDRDGVPNVRDLDSDNDGIRDNIELAAALGVDTDIDGIADIFDADIGNDGETDANKTDADSDGINDNVDAQVNSILRADIDGDGIVDTAFLVDSDRDGLPNVLDIDSDNDGVPDLDEAGGFRFDSSGNGRIDGADTNVNGLIDTVDNALNNTVLSITDTDADGVPDTLDIDADGDGLTDLVEAGLRVFDPDGDGVVGGDDFIDTNNNGLHDLADSSVAGKRAGFIDRNFDGIPDFKSIDSDGDGLSDLIEAVGRETALILDADGNGVVGSQDMPVTDINGNGLADNLEGVEGNIDTRAAVDVNRNGVPDSIDAFLLDIQVRPAAQSVDPETNTLDPLKADFDRDGYPDVTEVMFGGNPLNGSEKDSDANGIPDWVDNTDIDGNGSVDNDNDGFSDLFEQIVGTDLNVATQEGDVFDRANTVLFAQNRYEGRSIKPVIWIDIEQSNTRVITVAADAGQASLTSHIGNFRIFGDARDASATPVYSWSATDGTLVNAITGPLNTQALTIDPASLEPGLYSVVLSVTLANHVSITQQIINIVASSALSDNDADRLPDTTDQLSADLGFLHSLEAEPGLFLKADSLVHVDGQDFSDKAVKLRAGQLATISQSGSITMTKAELDSAVATLVQRGFSAATTQDSTFDYGVIYDYEVINLPFVGASARVVIPLDTPVPLNGVLRKYSMQSGWQNFELDGNNIASAPWSNADQKICPSPDSTAFQTGLNEGHHCLRLTVSDGGKNDSEIGEGSVNGLIKDPVAMGVFAGTNGGPGRVESGVSGAGATPWYAVVMLMLYWLIGYKYWFYVASICRIRGAK